MRHTNRAAFTVFDLLIVLAVGAILFALLLPAVLKARQSAERMRSQNNLKQIGLACHNYHDTFASFPPGVDANHFSAAARLLPFVEQDNLFKTIDLQKPVTDPANVPARTTVVQVFQSSRDPQPGPRPDAAPTNYLFSAGSKPDLKDNDGIYFLDSKVRFADITDGTSNTIMAGETLKGDGGTMPVDVRRQYVRLGKDALAAIKDDSGTAEWAQGKGIVGDRCASWLDGRFLQGTFTSTRLPNDPKPDVDCDGRGGLSALRSLEGPINVLMGDGSVRGIAGDKIKPETWKALATRSGGEVIQADF